MTAEAPSDMTSEPSAAATFASLPELVEQMLLQLPLNETLLAERVSKTWKAIITRSPRIQKALFFRPTEAIQLHLVETRGIQPANCPSIKQCAYCCFRGCSFPKPGGITRWAVNIWDKREYRIVINPFLGIEAPWSEPYFRESERLGIQDKFARKEAYLRPEASWRKMLISQPPLKGAIVDHLCAPHWHWVKAKGGSKGMTLGDVHRSAQAFKGTVRSIWGEDGFAPGVPPGSSGEFVLAQLDREPADDVDGEDKGGYVSDDGWSDSGLSESEMYQSDSNDGDGE